MLKLAIIVTVSVLIFVGMFVTIFIPDTVELSVLAYLAESAEQAKVAGIMASPQMQEAVLRISELEAQVNKHQAVQQACAIVEPATTFVASAHPAWLTALLAPVLGILVYRKLRVRRYARR